MRVRAVERRRVRRLQAAMDFGQRLLKIAQLAEHGREGLRRRRLLVAMVLELGDEARHLTAQPLDLVPHPLAVLLRGDQPRLEAISVVVLRLPELTSSTGVIAGTLRSAARACQSRK